MNTIKKITAGVSAFQELFSTEKNRLKYQDFLSDLLFKANYVNFGTVNFKKIKEDEKLRLYLAYADANLYGILVSESSDFIEDKSITDTEFYISSFGNSSFKIDPSLKPTENHPNQISYNELSERRNLWENNYTTWTNDNLKNGFLVNYFEIDAANFSAKVSNSCTFGLIESKNASYNFIDTFTNEYSIDLVVINDAYMDTVRPVPPYKP